MNSLSRMFIVSVLGLLVVGCEKENHDSYSYLVRHPFTLEKEYNRCQALRLTDPEQQTQCKVVNEAAKQVADVMSEQRNHPELFGQRILQAETTANDLATQLAAAERDVKPGQSQQAAINDIKKNLAAKREEIKMLLAVMGISTPE